MEPEISQNYDKRNLRMRLAQAHLDGAFLQLDCSLIRELVEEADDAIFALHNDVTGDATRLRLIEHSAICESLAKFFLRRLEREHESTSGYKKEERLIRIADAAQRALINHSRLLALASQVGVRSLPVVPEPHHADQDPRP